MDFSTKLRNLRIERNLTQMEMAKMLGSSQASITAWENARREPDFATITKLAKFFGVPMTALLPSSDDVDESYVNIVAESLHENPKLNTLFELVRNFGENDLDAMIAVAKSISGRRE